MNLTLRRRTGKGFTLIEMLLVMVIMSVIVMALISYTEERTEALRRDRTVLQIQQIQNAALAYYVSNSTWPNTVNDLQVAGFLPRNVTIVNPWGNNYYMNADDSKGTFAVCTGVEGSTKEEASALADILTSRLPSGFTSNEPADTNCSPSMSATVNCNNPLCTVTSFINIPGQNLNNARSINFAGMYHNGACVPVPTCPGATSGPNSMAPAIMVVPVSVSGVLDSNSRVYPLSSFTAFATPIGTNPPGPPACFSSALTPCDMTKGGIPSPNGQYWRVCLQVITSDGEVTSFSNPDWGSEATIMAITRCVPNQEPFGTSFDVWSSD